MDAIISILIIAAIIVAIVGWSCYILFWVGTGVLLIMALLFLFNMDEIKNTDNKTAGYYYSLANDMNDNMNYNRANELYKKAYNQKGASNKDKIRALGGIIITCEKTGKESEAKFYEDILERIDPYNKWLLKRR